MKLYSFSTDLIWNIINNKVILHVEVVKAKLMCVLLYVFCGNIYEQSLTRILGKIFPAQMTGFFLYLRSVRLWWRANVILSFVEVLIYVSAFTFIIFCGIYTQFHLDFLYKIYIKGTRGGKVSNILKSIE